MKLRILAVGTRMPTWVKQGFEDYAIRLPHECTLSLTEIPLGQRSKTRHSTDAIAQEGERMLRQISTDDEVIALDVTGKTLATESLAHRLGDWLTDGRDRVFLIGGPDGLSRECLERANWRWSLSALTLPHGLARVVTVEALYRAWTVLRGHPYHRA